MTPSVELREISKRFGNIIANDRVNFTLFPGEIHSIIGGNGAGKSTLVKILYGILRQDSGTVFIYGKPRVFRHPKDARAVNIGMVHQEMLLLETQTVMENIILGSEPTRFGWLQPLVAGRKIQKIIDRHKLDIDLHKKVFGLTVGERQRILITRLLYQEAQILILDEPTAALTPQETDTLFSVLTSLKENGASIIFISHKLPEVLKFSDHISIMRSGKMIATIPGAEAKGDVIIELMTGERLPPLAPIAQQVPLSGMPKTKQETDCVFILQDIHCDWGSCPLKGVTVKVNAGEIVGILGVEGNGQSELESIISGLEGKYSGKILFNGDPLPQGEPHTLKANHIGYIPSHREENGIVSSFSIAENIILGRHTEPAVSGKVFLKQKEITAHASTLIDEYDIQSVDESAEIHTLSGGNQQKVVLSRELSQQPKVLIACNPTRGVDIKTSYYIHKRLFEMAEKGCAILVMLSDIEEAKLLCHRIAILYDGRITRIVASNEATETELGYYMIGGR